MLRILKSIILWTALYCNAIFFSVSCYEFNRNLTGVTLQPYVLNSSDSLSTSFTFAEVKTMLKIISRKFSRVATIETSNTASYKTNVTYYNTYSEIYTAEAAAQLNREALLNKSSPNIRVYIGTYVRTDPNRMNTEIKLAIEAARQSNQIHSGTSLGIILGHANIANDIKIANIALSAAQQIKGEAKSLNLEIGVKTSCNKYHHISNTPENMLIPIEKTFKSFLLHFDFIVCIRYEDEYYPLGLTKTFELITKDLAQLRKSINLMNPYVEFMAQTHFSTLVSSHYQFQLQFWTMMDQWCTRNNIKIWMYEAFDNPWKVKFKPKEAHNGWWRHTSGQSLTDLNAYKEKVLELSVASNSRNEKSTTHKQPDATTKPQIDLNNKEQRYLAYIGNIIGPSVGVVALTLLVVHWIRTNKFRRSLLTKEEVKGFKYGPSKKNDMDMQDETVEMHALHKPYDKSFEIPKKHFQIDWSSILGCGKFGVVHKANIISLDNQEGGQVAVKMPKDNCPKTAVMSILSEIKILLYLGSHENIVSIKGAYTAEIEKGVIYLATELCDFGSLKNFLRKLQNNEGFSRAYQNIISSNLNIEFIQLIQWSYEIACGMEYLGEKKVVHADLVTRNVLLTADKIAKITDFGLSRRLYEYTEYVKKQQEPLPWRWMAIEALRKLEFSSQSDVWSYGVTLWEVFSMGDVPYPGLSWSLEFVDDLETGLRMKCPCLASPEIYTMMSSCWKQEPQRKATFT